MSVIYTDNLNMDSPLNNSPLFGGSYTDHSEIQKFEQTLVFKYLINHSFNLLISNFQSKFQNLQIQNLNQFIQTIFQRLNITLPTFQKMMILLIRFLSKNDQVILSVKQVISGVLIKLIGIESKSWSMITGLPYESLVRITQHINLDDDELFIDESEVDELNEQMKNIIYSKFEVI